MVGLGDGYHALLTLFVNQSRVTKNGAGDQSRTDNLRITIPLLCQIELRRPLGEAVSKDSNDSKDRKGYGTALLAAGVVGVCAVFVAVAVLAAAVAVVAVLAFVPVP